MKSFKSIVYRILPMWVKQLINFFIFNIRYPMLYQTRNQYRYTDEHLKFTHILEAMNYIRVAGADGRVLPQTYFEFGCHSGRTFSAAVNSAKFLRVRDPEFYAFDSFEGLPGTKTEEDGYFQAGTFCTCRDDFVGIVRKKTGLSLDDKYIVQGYYCDSLTPEVQGRMPKAGVVHIDVDLYSSTVEVLEFVKPLLVAGTLLIFDDWYCFPGGSLMGERRALTEFLDKNPSFEVEPWKSYSTFGQSFFVSKVSQSQQTLEKSKRHGE